LPGFVLWGSDPPCFRYPGNLRPQKIPIPLITLPPWFEPHRTWGDRGSLSFLKLAAAFAIRLWLFLVGRFHLGIVSRSALSGSRTAANKDMKPGVDFLTIMISVVIAAGLRGNMNRFLIPCDID